MNQIVQRLLPDSATITADTLHIGGCNVESLATRYGTPLYIHDEATLRLSAQRVQAAFAPLGARVSFAAKACSTLAVLRIFQQEGLDLDVVSLGELEAGLRVGFAPTRIHLHGNYKTDEELDRAVRLDLHAVVADNIEELDRLETLCRQLRRTPRVMLRLSLRLEAETHPYLRTSGHRSKFGLLHESEEELRAIEKLEKSEVLRLVGLHAHLGSQLTDCPLYGRCATELASMALALRNRGFPVAEISVGGGWAVAYRPGDDDLAPERVVQALAPATAQLVGIRLGVEPGRALVARAAVAVYRAGSVKWREGRRLIAVDGGMGDNPRTALYGARYTALRVRGTDAPPLGAADVVGRYCESGDVLAHDVQLPQVSRGDLLCLPVAGAYQLSMASSYNLVPPPAAVMVHDGSSCLITRRPTTDELLAREIL